MKRALTEQETKQITTAIERETSNLTENNKALEMTNLHKEYLIQKRKYEDEVRPWNRKNEDQQIDNTIKGYASEIKMSEEKLKDLREQLNGVEVRESTSIN